MIADATFLLFASLMTLVLMVLAGILSEIAYEKMVGDVIEIHAASQLNIGSNSIAENGSSKFRESANHAIEEKTC